MNTLEIATDKLHYKRIREDPLYRMMLQMNDMRAELEPSQCQDIPKESDELDTYRHYPHTHTYTKKQAGRLFLRIEALENSYQYLIREEKERRANASKRKPTKYTVK